MKLRDLLFLVFLLTGVLAIKDGLIHEKGRCALYGTGHSGNLPVTYVSNIRSQRVSKDDLNLSPPHFMLNCVSKASESIREVLGPVCQWDFSENPYICCDESQALVLKDQLTIAKMFVKTCPACSYNLMKLWCTFTCHQDQSTFVHISATNKISGEARAIVEEVDFYVDRSFGEGIFESCKSVKYGGMNDDAIDIIGGGAKSYLEMLNFMGKKNPNGPSSPFTIRFTGTEEVPEDANMERLSTAPKKCNETGPFRCECFDCDGSCENLDTSLQESSDICRVLGLDCTVAVIVVIYIILGLSLTWVVIFYNRRYRMYQEVFQSAEMYDEAILDESVRSRSRIVDRVLQDLMLKTAKFSSENPVVVIMIGIIIALIASYGWIRVELETDPVKLWTSKKGEILQQKEFFDLNFGPFYRTEQIILAVKETNGSIVSRDYLPALFDIERGLRNISVQDDCGFQITLDDLCYKPLGNSCLIQSVTAYWQHSYEKFRRDRTWLDHFETCTRNPTNPSGCLSGAGVPIKPETVLGGFENTSYATSRAFFITVLIENPRDSLIQRRSLLWESSASLFLRNLSFPGIEILFMTEVNKTWCVLGFNRQLYFHSRF